MVRMYLKNRNSNPQTKCICMRLHRPGNAMTKWWSIFCLAVLSASLLVNDAAAQSYQTRKLIRNLIKIGYPVDREDVIALDKIGMRFDTKNRLDVLKKILEDRQSIHNRTRFDYFTRTEIICDALRLMDEHDLPATDLLIDQLNRQDGWENRERALLAFMSAKRGIRYRENTDFLLEVLPRYDRDLEKNYGVDASQAIIDIMNFLSYLADLYIYKSDETILLSLFGYASKAYGFPAEYLSHMFVDMFLFDPELYLSNLSNQEDGAVNTVITSMVFGIRNNQIREKITEALKQRLFTDGHPRKAAIDRIIE